MDAKSIVPNRMYDDLAYLWPAISPPEEYAEEAGHWRSALRELLGPGRHRILELGVGGGHNLSHLAAEFEATAVDLSEHMLAHSRALNPSVAHHQGDMRSVRLGQKFAAVLAHDAIAYMLTEDDLRAVFSTAAAHLDPGGVFLTAPDHFRDELSLPDIDHATHTAAGIRLTYSEFTYDPDPSDTQVETIYTYFIEREGGLSVELDRHTTGIFPRATWARLMREAGFTYEERPFSLRDYDREYVLLAGRLGH